MGSRSMTFTQSDKLNEELISKLQSKKIIKTPKVAQTMLTVDRYYYSKNYPYADSPQTIGYGATISAPHMHAYVLELLCDKLLPGETALDVGCGSGYLTACMAVMMGADGVAIGIDHIPELIYLATNNVAAGNLDLLESGRTLFIVGDGRRGYPEYAPYNAIHVGAAANKIPQALLDQLKDGGRLVIPLGSNRDIQELVQIDKSGRDIVRRHVSTVSFVPLTTQSKQWKSSSSTA